MIQSMSINMKKILLPLISLLAIGLCASLPNKTVEEVKAAPELSLAGDGDNFLLTDKYFGANESFVYSADLHFRNGQAGGLVFGVFPGNMDCE